MRRIILVVAFCSFVPFAGYAEAQEFYYGRDGAVPVSRDSTKILIKLDPAIPAQYSEAALDSIERIVMTLPDSQAIDEFVVCSLKTESGFNEFLDSLHEVTSILFAEPFYVLEDGSPLYVGQ